MIKHRRFLLSFLLLATVGQTLAGDCLSLNDPFASAVGPTTMTVGWTNSCSDPVVSIEVRVMEGYNSYWITNWSGTSNSFILTDFSLIGPNRRVLFQFYSFPGGVRRFETEGFVASLAVPPTSVNPTFDQMGPRGFRVKWAGGANLTGTQYQVQLSKFSDFSVMAAEETTTVNPWTASCLEPGNHLFRPSPNHQLGRGPHRLYPLRVHRDSRGPPTVQPLFLGLRPVGIRPLPWNAGPHANSPL
jgi:hypothetical protein